MEPVKVDESMLTEAERKMVEDFSQKIDIMDSNLVLQYGAAAQKNVAGFSENALASVRTKDLGEVGSALSDLVVELKGFGQEDKKGILGFFLLFFLLMTTPPYLSQDSNVRLIRLLKL